MSKTSITGKRYVLTRRELKLADSDSAFAPNARMAKCIAYLVSLRATKAGCNTVWSFDKGEAKIWPSRNLVDTFRAKHSYLKARIGVVVVIA